MVLIMDTEQTVFTRIKINTAPSRRLLGFLLLSGILFLSVVIPPFHEGEFTVCILKNALGIPCPGCGMTRAFLFFGHGDVHTAMKLNINSLLIFPMITIMWLHGAFTMLTGREVKVILTRRELFFVCMTAGTAMVSSWAYNIFLNPWV